MFISMKRRVSSALINAVIKVVFILACYLAKHVAVMYQQYQKADSGYSCMIIVACKVLCAGWMGIWGSWRRLSHIHTGRSGGVEGLGEQFNIVQRAVRGSLSIDLKHENVVE